MDLTGLATYVYARKSNPDAVNPGKSTTDQMDVQRERVEARGAWVKREFIDEGIGASRYSKVRIRMDFQQLIDGIESDPEVKLLSFWALSRAARDEEISHRLINACERRGVLLLVGDRTYDPASWEDRMQLGFTAVIDAAEVARTRDGTLRGIEKAAVAGRPHGRNLYGYTRTYDPRTRALVSVDVVPEQAKVLREILRRVLAGEPNTAIARDLRRRGITKLLGGAWQPGDVSDFLRRSAYYGKRDHKAKLSDAMWPAIYAEKDALKALELLSKNSRGDWSTGAKHMLTGVVKCGACDGPMYMDSSRPVPAYVCKAFRYRETNCNRSRGAEHLERYVRKVVNGWLADPDFARMRRARLATVDTGAEELELAALSAELDEAYEAGLSVRGLAAIERRILPRIEELRHFLDEADRVRGQRMVLPPKLPEPGSAAERELLRDLVRVTCLPAKRGRGFDYSSVDIVPR